MINAPDMWIVEPEEEAEEDEEEKEEEGAQKNGGEEGGDDDEWDSEDDDDQSLVEVPHFGLKCFDLLREHCTGLKYIRVNVSPVHDHAPYCAEKSDDETRAVFSD